MKEERIWLPSNGFDPDMLIQSQGRYACPDSVRKALLV